MPARSPPQARALRLGMGRHLRAALSLAEPRFSSGLFVPGYHAPLWPLCPLGHAKCTTCQRPNTGPALPPPRSSGKLGYEV